MCELLINGNNLMIQSDHPQVLEDVVTVRHDGEDRLVRIKSVAHFGDSTKFQYNVEPA